VALFLVDGFVNKFTNGSTLTVNISKAFLEQIPIMPAKEQDMSRVISLVDKMLLLNKFVIEGNGKHTDKLNRYEEEAKETDRQIDELIYKIYGITEEKKKVIEESY